MRSRPIVPPRLLRMRRRPFARPSKGGSIMSEAQLASLAAWQNFYVIIGSAAARLSGLLFVVITLVSGTLGRVSSPWSGIRVFSTPSADAFWCCAAARDHGHPQRVGCRDLHAHRSPPVSEQEPGLAGVLRRWACACSSAVRTRRVGRPSTRKGIKLDPPGTLRISGAADEPSITSRYTGFSLLKNRSRPGRDVGTAELEQPG